MLCELVELGKKKCERYIPSGVGDIEYYGGTVDYCISIFQLIDSDIKVTLVVSRNEDQFLYSELLVEKPEGNEQKIRKMYHWQWRDWSDIIYLCSITVSQCVATVIYNRCVQARQRSAQLGCSNASSSERSARESIQNNCPLFCRSGYCNHPIPT